jgi:hypothetical protein
MNWDSFNFGKNKIPAKMKDISEIMENSGFSNKIISVIE